MTRWSESDVIAAANRARNGHQRADSTPERAKAPPEATRKPASASEGIGSHIRTFDLVPVPKPRQTRSDKWRERPAVVRYRAFADELRAQSAGMVFPESGATVIFHLPMPKSWSAKRRAAMNGEPHRQRPDLDNLLKAIMDALLPEDCAVHQLSIGKRWAAVGYIEVELLRG